MKFLKIILIIVLLSVSFISYGTGSITSGDNVFYFEPEEVEVPNTIDEWFAKLPLNQKVEIYIAYCGRDYTLNE